MTDPEILWKAESHKALAESLSKDLKIPVVIDENAPEGVAVIMGPDTENKPAPFEAAAMNAVQKKVPANVERELNRLSDAISELNGLIENLELRLSPGLNSNVDPTENPDEAFDPTSMSTVARMICENRERIEALQRYVTSITLRVDL